MSPSYYLVEGSTLANTTLLQIRIVLLYRVDRTMIKMLKSMYLWIDRIIEICKNYYVTTAPQVNPPFKSLLQFRTPYNYEVILGVGN